MQAPAETSRKTGTWGCNGEHKWLAFSNGTDQHKDKYDVIKPFEGDVTPISGCRNMYSFRATDATVSDKFWTIDVKFMQCYCQGKERRMCVCVCGGGGQVARWYAVI